MVRWLYAGRPAGCDPAGRFFYADLVNAAGLARRMRSALRA